MERFEHGGNIYLHEGVLDFSANLNPLGMPNAAKHALQASVELFEPYPDPSCTNLVRAIASFENVDAEYVLATAGATDALTRACQVIARSCPRGRVLVCAPGYSGHEQAIEHAGMEVVRHPLHEQGGFRVDESILNSINAHIDAIVLANPNNPTGLCLDAGLLHEIVRVAHDATCTVVLDESFVDLTQEAGSTNLLPAFPNLVLVKALTKSFALAGLRIGYALCTNRDFLCAMKSAGQPWAVSTPAQIAGVAVVQESEYLSEARCLLARERPLLAAALESLGLLVIPSDANYLLFKGSAGLQELLLEQGILIRTCDNFFGLDSTWYRVAVRTHEQNDRLICALRSVIA